MFLGLYPKSVTTPTPYLGLSPKKLGLFLSPSLKLKVIYLTVDPLHLPHPLLLHLLEWPSLKEHKLTCEHIKLFSLLERI